MRNEYKLLLWLASVLIVLKLAGVAMFSWGAIVILIIFLNIFIITKLWKS